MSDDISLDQVMARRFQLVDELAQAAARHKVELAPLNEELSLCETFIKQHMLAQNLQQVKTGAGMTFFTTKDSVTVKDMDAVVRFMIDAAPAPDGMDPAIFAAAKDHIFAHGLWGLLNKAVNKTNAKELIEAKTPPPGVEYSAYKDLSWRRA